MSSDPSRPGRGSPVGGPVGGGPVADGPHPEVDRLAATIPLVDHHTHGIVRGTVSPSDYAFMLDESDRRASAEVAGLDTQVGFAVRRWVGPLLDLEPGAPVERFLERRLGLTNEAAAAILLPAARLERLIVETGFRGDELLSPMELGALAHAPSSTVVRLEALAERVAIQGPPAAGFADSVRGAIAAELAAGAVGLKSIVAYRHGLDVDPTRPSEAEVTAQAGMWLRDVDASRRARIDDPVLLRFLLWTAVDTGWPLQIHTGYGDPDLDLRRADPLLLTDFLRATEGRGPVLLLHTYPFHRQAGYLAQMFPHVYLDVGLALNYAGAQATAIVAESLELAPFGKVLYSSDAWGLPDLHLLGSILFRRAVSRVIGGWVASGDWSLADAERVIRLVGTENARRVYGTPAA